MREICSRVVDVEDPVEDEVDTERQVDEVRVVFLDALVHGGDGVDHLDHVHQLVVLRAQAVLVERVDGVVHVQQINCEEEQPSGEKDVQGRGGCSLIQREHEQMQPESVVTL